MSTARRLFKNTFVLILANALQPVLSLFVFIYMSKIVGVDGIGQYSTILKYVATFQIIAAFGLRSLLTREIAQKKDMTQKLLIAGSVLSLFVALFCAVAMSLLVSSLSNDAVVLQGAMIALFSLFASALIDTYEGAISGHEKLSHIGYASILETFVRVVVSILLLINGFGVIALTVIHVLARYSKCAYYFVYIQRSMARPYGRINWADVLEMLKKGWVFALIVACVAIYWNTDSIMIEALRDIKEAGYYGVAYRLFAPSLFVVDSFVNSLFPVISNVFQKSLDEFQKISRMALRFMCMATVPIAIAISGRADEIIAFLFDADFAESTQVLQILIWCLIPYGISQVLAYVLVASNNQKRDLVVNALSMASNIILNLLLIPVWGYLGATLATLISINLYVLYQLPLIYRKLLTFNFKGMTASLLHLAVAGILMRLFMDTMAETHFLIVIPFACIIYGISLFATGAFTHEDKQFFKSVMKRRT